MTKQELKKYFGLPGWLALYEVLLNSDKINCAKVVLTEPAELLPKTMNRPAKEWHLLILEIKALAFDEIYEKLPMSASLDVLRDTLSESATIAQDKSLKFVIEFFNNIPTRNK